MEQFDYIIVGGGTAGCILANRLTASGRHRVLMLEAGGEPTGRWIPIPAGFSKLLVNPIYNWRFETEPEDNTFGRKIAVPRGKGLGGSTLINGMIFVRGQDSDFDRWVEAGARGWDFATMEPYLRKVENFPEGGARRGKDGPMRVTPVRVRAPITEAFVAAAVEDGQPLNDDYNVGDQSGFGYYQASQHRGRRWTVVDGYLDPARSRANLKVETGAHVLNLVLEGTRCVGVTYRQGGRDVTARANAEVLMAAGAIQTPQILEVSGIGRPSLLQSLGIPVKHALENVGENYLDHYCTRMNWKVKGTYTLNEQAQGWRLGLAVAEYFSKRSGILTLGTGLAYGFVRSKPELPTPDVQYFFMHASYADASKRILDSHPGMTIGVTQLRPESAGSIHARSADPFAAPVIRPNFLASDVDRDSLIGGMEIARRIVGRPALAKYVEAEKSPGAGVATRDEWLHFARENGQTIYHPVGTCRMGEDDGAVVDPRLRVKGIAGLRVVDASVMPTMVSGNTQVAVMVIAERAADLILADDRAC